LPEIGNRKSTHNETIMKWLDNSKYQSLSVVGATLVVALSGDRPLA
jgi:hypothetical protein